MNATSAPMFLHELRRAVRECPRLLAIVPLVTAFTLLVYHGVIPVRFDDRLGFLGNFLNFPWPILAWISPYLILKTPDLQDRNALWRTLPATRTEVFGSRILLATIFTVVIPAILVAGAELAVSSGQAWPQFLLMAAYQWAYLWIGAFAAFARRGHRGVVLMVIMAIVVSGVAVASLRYGHSQLTDRGEFNSTLIRFLPHWGLVAIGGPLVVLWRIRRAGKPANPFIALAVAAASIPAIIAIENRVVMHPVMRGERLPTLRAEIDPYLPGPEITILTPGVHTNYIAYVYASAGLSLPPECAGARLENKAGKYATGSWENLRGRGSLDDFASNRAPTLILTSVERTSLENGQSRRAPGDPVFSNLGETLGLPSDPEFWIPSDKTQSEPSRWRRTSPGLSRRSLDAAFLLPNPATARTEVYDFKSLQKDPVRIRAEVTLPFDAAPKVICRAPMKDIRTINGQHEVTLSMASTQHSVTGVYGDRVRLALTVNKRLAGGPLADVFRTEDVPQYAGLAVNRRLGQVVLLGEQISDGGPHNLPCARARETYCYFRFAKEDVGDLPESWWNEAEFVLLESEPGPAKILPLDIEIKAPAPASAK